MQEIEFIQEYLNRYQKSLLENDVSDSMISMKKLLLQTRDIGKKVLIVGNGGSAAMASHVAVDFTKAASIRAITFNEADLLTCFANDYGYEQWVVEALNSYADSGDIAILISSSGTSKNIVNGAVQAKKLGLKTITLSGFSKNNDLIDKGDVNFWIDSSSYNVVEMTHHVWLVAIIDYLIEISVKSLND